MNQIKTSKTNKCIMPVRAPINIPNINDTITEIKTNFLKVLEILKTYYYKLKNAAKEYIKEISVDKNVKDRKVEKTVEHVPQNNK